MHELSICRNIIEIVTKEMQSRRLCKIDELGIRVGILSGVDPDALKFAFTAAARDTVLRDTTLKIECVPVAAHCQQCGGKTSCEDHTYTCTACGSTELNITHGNELEIAYLVEPDEK